MASKNTCNKARNTIDIADHSKLNKELSVEEEFQRVIKATRTSIIINDSNENKFKNIFDAVESCNVSAVEDILNKNTDIEVRDELNNTILHSACKVGCVDMVRMLVNRGASLKSKNNELDTPLHTACKFGNKEIVNIFIENEMFINIRNQFNNTPLHVASENDHFEIVRLLLKNGADIKIKNEENKSAFMLAENNDCVNVINAFLDENILNQEEKKALLLVASSKNWVGLVERLIKSKVNVNCTGEYSPLQIAAIKGNDEIILQLLKHGADVHYRDELTKKTALYYAAEIDNLKSVILLIRYKSNIDEDVLGRAAMKDRYHTIEYLLNKGANIDGKEKFGYSALHFGAICNCENTVELLLERGADINSLDNTDRTPLSRACESGALKTVSHLLKRGADVNTQCKNLMTPLHYACKYGNISIVQLLLQHGADKTIKDKKNKTAIAVAKNYKNKKIIALL